MTTATEDRRDAILALEPRLLDTAQSMTRDANEADVLVAETLMAAKDLDYGAGAAVGAETWIFGLLRRHFYSVERDRDYRRSRSSVITELGYARKRAMLAKAAAQAQDAQ
jgi:DNA-directed RNA polymerase specialized sigma24 family protein